LIFFSEVFGIFIIVSHNNKKYHYIYRTTCKVTGEYYIGIHSTDNLNDGYMGSGVLLKHSIKKHGVENHKHEILEFVSNRKMLSEVEKGVLTKEILEDIRCLNLKEGGDGGYMSSEERRKIAKAKKRKHRYIEKKNRRKKEVVTHPKINRIERLPILKEMLPRKIERTPINVSHIKMLIKQLRD
jgi:hypothetical protein